MSALLILGAGAVHFLAPDTVSPQLQLLIAAGAAYLIHDWAKVQLTKQQYSVPRTAPGIFALWAAVGFFAISFIAPQASPWCLTLSLVSYLLWLFGRTVSHAAHDQDHATTQTAMKDENTDAVEDTRAHIRNIKKSRK